MIRSGRINRKERKERKVHPEFLTQSTRRCVLAIWLEKHVVDSPGT